MKLLPVILAAGLAGTFACFNPTISVVESVVTDGVKSASRDSGWTSAPAAVCDTLSGAVRLNWQPGPAGRGAGFKVLRRAAESNAELAVIASTRDTFYVDRIFAARPHRGQHLASDSLAYRYEYRVAQQARGGKNGRVSPPCTATVAPPAMALTRLTGAIERVFADTTGANDSVVFVLRYKNPGRMVVMVAWSADSASIEGAQHEQKAHAGVDTFITRWPVPGEKLVRAAVYDDGGAIRSFDTALIVVPDRPVAHAGRDTLVTIGHRAVLRGTGMRRYGHIDKYEWRAPGSADYVETPGGTMGVTAPAVPGDYRYVLRVTGRDSATACDSVWLRVVLDPPRVSAGADSTVGFNRPIRLHGNVQHGASIAAYAWDIGATGTFVRTAGPDTVIAPRWRTMRSFPCVFRATDDQGESGADTVHFNLSVVWDSAAVPFPVRSGHAAAVWNDRLWIVGGGLADVWSSGDGVHWSCATADAPFGKLYGHTAVVFSGRLWIIGGRVKDGECPGSVWMSADGEHWDQAVTGLDCLKRYYHASVAYRGTMWIMGGLAVSHEDRGLRDVWRSVDGVNWHNVTLDAAFGERYGQAAVAFDSSMVVVGGFPGGSAAADGFRDVWISTDGSSWRKSADLPDLCGACYHSSVSIEGTLWLLGGYNTILPGGMRFDDIWCSSDRTTWRRAAEGSVPSDRYFHTTVYFHDRLWAMVGGNHSILMSR